MTEAPTRPPAAIVLYGRAAFAQAQGLARLAEAVRHALGPSGADRRIAVAFADLTGPSLPEVLDALVAEGVGEVDVVTCMVPADPSLSTWLPGALSQWRADRATTVTVRLSPPVEAALDMATAVVAVLAPADGRDVAETAPSLGKPGWSKIPEHGRQLFFCVGARCLHRAAEPLYQHLRSRMKQHRALTAGPHRVMCARSSCLYPCNLGPLMTVHPDGVWYSGLTVDLIDRIVDEHLIDGKPVAEGVVHVTGG